MPVAAALFAVLTVSAAHAQREGDRMRREYRSLGELLDAAAVADMRAFDALAAIDAAPALRDAREQFASSLRMRAQMSMADMMAMMRMPADMSMLGPFDGMEAPASRDLVRLFASGASRGELRAAFDDSILPAGAVDLLRRGLDFERRIFDVLATETIADKAAVLDAASAAWLADGLTVPGQPKSAGLLLDHMYGGAFAEGYPRLSRIVRSAQWLRLAALEAMIFEEQGSGYWGSVAEVESRFRARLAGSADGASPAPVELPMAPAIAPTLYSLSPQTAIILDNISMFRAIAADLLAWPGLNDRSARIEALVDEFTDHERSLDTPIDYLVSALRGGIYNQGGPAIGELEQSERNRSRMEMGMQHAMIMSPQ